MHIIFYPTGAEKDFQTILKSNLLQLDIFLNMKYLFRQLYDWLFNLIKDVIQQIGQLENNLWSLLRLF